MKTKTVMMALVFLAVMLTAAFGEAIVTLKSGEVLHGDIVSDTNDVLRIRAFSANRTISSLRSVPRSDVQNVQIETSAEAAERIDYLALSKFQLNADQEQSTAFYNHWIAVFEKFLNDYPKSDKTTIIQQRIEVCQAELKHVADGDVKFANKWMTPEEKKPQALNKQLTELTSQRDSLAKTVTALRGRLQGQQTKLQNLRDSQESVYATKDGGPPNHYAVRYLAGQRTVPHPERPAVLADITWCQQQIGSQGVTLANLDAKIQSLKIQIPQAQHAYEVALTKTNQESVQVAVAPPSPPLTVEPPVVVTRESWIVQNKKALAIGGGVLLILLILAYPLKRLLQKLGLSEAKRDEQRRVAHEKLKKVFDRVFAEGERPAGDNTPEGEIIPIGKGEDSYGGGRWFVIADAHIWAVQNNGRDTDNWVYNNVITKGRGAVGARIPMDPELADYINITANAAK